MVFSSRAFTTKQVELATQAGAVAAGSASPGNLGQAQGNRDVETPLNRSHQQYDGPGDTATSTQPCAVPNAQVGTVQMNRAAVDSTLSVDATANDVAGTSLCVEKTSSSDTQAASSETSASVKPTIREESMLQDATDTDYLPSSSYESESKFERDEPSEANDSDKELKETHTPLEFQIPQDALHAAMTAPENSKASFWSSNLYRGSEDRKILVHYCKTKEVAEKVAQKFVNEKVVGFDIEWKPYAHPASIKGNVSLIQLACEDRIALFHLALFSGSSTAQLMPPTLKNILESPDIFKVGVAVKGDFSRIVKFLHIEPQGVFELSRLHNLVQYFATDPSKVSNKLVGLAAQVQQHLQLPLYKGGQLIDDPEDTANVRSSDWSLPLNNQQIHYAAADAYAGFRLYDALEEKRKKLKPTPPRPLVCDYDNKPKPRSSDSKARKKRKAAVKPDDATSTTAEQVAASAGQEEEVEEVEEEPAQSQETEGYETAQEGLLDSHQLEGEEPQSSQHSYKSSDESEMDMLSESEADEPAAAMGPSQRRVGRVNLSRLRESDPGYPTLPDFQGGREIDGSSDEDFVDISETSEAEDLAQSSDLEDLSDEDQETDEFDDSELEEALQDLTIESDGELQEDTRAPSKGSFSLIDTRIEAEETLQRIESHVKKLRLEDAEAVALHEFDTTRRRIEESEMQIEGMKKQVHERKTAERSRAAPSVEATFNRDEQRLIDLLNDPEIIGFLHASPAQPVASAFTQPYPAPHTTKQSESSQSPEYNHATTWARTYIANTIPSPTSPAPSHIRATIPHLRAYNMWHHQGLSLGEIAKHLRDPPLSESTVGSYVLQAITLEKMEYDREAVKGVLMGMPEASRKGRWRGLSEKVGAK